MLIAILCVIAVFSSARNTTLKLNRNMPVSRSICNPASITDGNVYARMIHSAMSISNVNRQLPHPESLVVIV